MPKPCTLTFRRRRCRYKAIGGGSPLRRITEEQGAALARSLQRKGTEASVYVAMRYWKPFTEEAIEQVRPPPAPSACPPAPLFPPLSRPPGSFRALLPA